MADYTRTIVFNVKDQQIRRATDRLFKSLERIEKKLDVIAGKGSFDNLAKGADRAASSYSKLEKAHAGITKASVATRRAIGDTATKVAKLSAAAYVLHKALNATNLKVLVPFRFVSNELAKGVDVLKGSLLGLAAAHPVLTAAIVGSTAAYTLFGTKALTPFIKGIKAIPSLISTATKKINEFAYGINKLEEKVKLTTKALIEMAKADGLTGLKNLLATAVTEQNKLLTTSAGYIASVNKVREIESAVNKELIARQKILDNIVQKEVSKTGTGHHISEAVKAKGLEGLNNLYREQEAILNRMVSTDAKYLEQAVAVRNIEIAINTEKKAREATSKAILETEKQTLSIAERIRNVAGSERVGKAAKGASSLFRPGAGTERRGAGIAGIGAAGLATTGAFGLQNWMAAHSSLTTTLPKLGEFTIGVKMAQAQATGFAGALDQIGKALLAHPGWLGIAAAAYMAFGVKAFTVPERLAKKAAKTTFGLGKALGNAIGYEAKQKILNGGLSAHLNTINLQLKDMSLAAQKAGASLQNIRDTHMNMKGNVRRSRRTRAAAGTDFADFSRSIDIAYGEYSPYKLAESRYIPPKNAMAMGGGTYWQGASSPIIGSLSAINKSIARHQRKIEKNGKALHQIEGNTKQIANPGITANPVAYAPGTAGPARAPGAWQNMFSMGRGGAPKGVFGMPRGQRLSSMASSGLIGGGFPLLFGQGGPSAIGGGIGGLAGGALGGGFGFGLSVVGTVIGTKIQEVIDFRKAVSELNKDMKLMGIDAGFSAKQIDRLGKSLGVTKQEALEIAKGFKRFGGKKGGLFAEFFGDAQLLTATAGGIDIESAISAIKAHSKEMTIEQELQYRIMLQTQGVEETINSLVEKRIELTRKQFDERQKQERANANRMSGSGNWGGGIGAYLENKRLDEELDKQIEKEKELLTIFNEQREAMKKMALVAEETAQSINTAIESIEKELRKLMNPQYQVVELANNIGSSFEDSFKGIIKGSLTAQEALANMFQRVADAFLDMAAQMIAAQLRMNMMGIFGSLFAGTPGGIGTKLTGIPTKPAPGMMTISGQRASGGPVTGGKTYLVGERGPELFTPNSAGSITSNKDMGGMTNISVNVDASGSSAEGDGARSAELGKLIGAAIQTELVKQKRPGGLLS